MRLWDLPTTEKDAIELLQKYGILPDHRVCKNSHPMKLYIGKQVFWKCNAEKCNQHVGMRSGNWFEGSRISFVTALRFIYCWCKELTSIKFCADELDIADKTVIDWSNYMRELCILEMKDEKRKKIGGEGCIVEVDLSVFVKRKNNARRLMPEQWVFGGVCRETNENFFVTVPDKTAATLIQEIINNIKEGSTIYLYCWKTYQESELENAGFLQATVSHNYNFINPDKGAHTKKVENLWGSAKWRDKKQRGAPRNHLDTYFIEFLWRQAHAAKKEDCFESMLKAIAVRFPPEKVRAD